MLAPFEQYLVDCIEQGEGDVYCLGRVGRKVKWAYDQFIEEYGWRIPHVGREQAMTEWLQGLCPSVRLVYTNYDVAQLRKEWSVSEREYDWNDVLSVSYDCMTDMWRIVCRSGIVRR